jgi:hypothetical protein
MSNREIAKLIWELEDTARWLDTQAERIASPTTDERVRRVMSHQFAGRAGLIRQIIAISKREGGAVTADVIREVQAISPQP